MTLCINITTWNILMQEISIIFEKFISQKYLKNRYNIKKNNCSKENILESEIYLFVPLAIKQLHNSVYLLPTKIFSPMLIHVPHIYK